MRSDRSSDAVNDHWSAIRDRGLVPLAFLDETFVPDLGPLNERGLVELHDYDAYGYNSTTNPIRTRLVTAAVVPGDIAAIVLEAFNPFGEWENDRSDDEKSALWDRAVRVALRLYDDPVAMQMATSGTKEAFQRLVAGMLEATP